MMLICLLMGIELTPRWRESWVFPHRIDSCNETRDSFGTFLPLMVDSRSSDV